MPIDFVLQTEPIDPAEQLRALDGDARAGACAVFVGRVRGAGVVKMEIECFPAMVQRQARQILAQARARWQLLGGRVVHRYGVLHPGDAIVLVAVAAVHRAPAFSACAFIMDYLKSRAPFWKKEWTADAHASWVAAADADEAAVQSWTAGGAHTGKRDG